MNRPRVRLTDLDVTIDQTAALVLLHRWGECSTTQGTVDDRPLVDGHTAAALARKGLATIRERADVTMVRMTARGGAVDQRPPLTWRRSQGAGGMRYEDATDPGIRVEHDGNLWHARIDGVELLAADTRREATEAVVARLAALETGATPTSAPPALRLLEGGADRPPAELEDLVAVAEAAGARRERLFGGQSSMVELVTMPDGRRAIHKTGHSWDDPDDVRMMMDGEELAPLVAQAVGAPVARVHRDGPGSVWVEHLDDAYAGDDQMGSPDAVRIGLLDTLVANRDREGNLGRHAGRLTGYDHGGTWLAVELDDTEPYLREPKAPMRHWVRGAEIVTDPPISAAELGEVRRRLEALRPDFAAAGRRGWLDYSQAMLSRIEQRVRERDAQNRRAYA
jgi:hypothetical protein